MYIFANVSFIGTRLLIHVHIYNVFGVRNTRTCAFDFACSQIIRPCALMRRHGRACATSWARVFSVYLFMTVRKSDVGASVGLSRVCSSVLCSYVC